jgi:hypothetical protein
MQQFVHHASFLSEKSTSTGWLHERRIGKHMRPPSRLGSFSSFTFGGPLSENSEKKSRLPLLKELFVNIAYHSGHPNSSAYLRLSADHSMHWE